MIITENLKLAKRGAIDLGQRIQAACDACSLTFTSVLRNLYENRSTYELDLCRSCKQRSQYISGSRERQRNTLIVRNKSVIGKTSEEIRGSEKTELMKARMSAKSKGENNPNFGGKYSRWEGGKKWHADRLGQSFEQKYGEERGSKLRQKYSENSSGKNNPMFGKPSPQGSGNGWSGWFNGFFFRSLLELSYLKECSDKGIELKSAESKKFAVQYEVLGVQRNYFPDYYIQKTNEVVEIKPSKLLLSNSIKFKAARNKYGDKFIVVTENDVDRLSNEEIKSMRDSCMIKFTDRYETKFKEKYDKN